MIMIPVKSSNISEIGHDKDNLQLNVTFKNGKTFGYLDVSQQEFNDLLEAQSVGRHFNQYLKAAKESAKVDKTEHVALKQ